MPDAQGMTRLDKRFQQLSIAFDLVDDFTGARHSDNTRVSIKNSGRKPIKNLSGYFIFLTLPIGEYAFIIEAEGFRPMEEIVEIAISNGQCYWGPPGAKDIDKDFKKAIEPKTIRLLPLPSYNFPAGSTVLRGSVFEDNTNNPIPGVQVEARVTSGKSLVLPSTTTTDRGEFVLYFTGLLVDLYREKKRGSLGYGILDLSLRFSGTNLKGLEVYNIELNVGSQVSKNFLMTK